MLSYVRREPSALLLAGQLLGVLVYPFMQGSEVGQALFSLFGIAILSLVVFAVSSTRSLTWVALLFGIPASVLLLIQAITGDDGLLPYSSAFEAVLYFYAAGALIKQVLGDHEVTRDEIFGVGATFTLVAWAFAYTFTVCQAIEPGSFALGVDASGDRTWMDLLYLSFSNLSATGLSDILPVEPFARSLLMLEQLAGLGFIAMVVARLVALTALRRPPQARRTPLLRAWRGPESNWRHHDFQSCALPTELPRRGP